LPPDLAISSVMVFNKSELATSGRTAKQLNRNQVKLI